MSGHRRMPLDSASLVRKRMTCRRSERVLQRWNDVELGRLKRGLRTGRRAKQVTERLAGPHVDRNARIRRKG